jgi:hypothetical protein
MSIVEAWASVKSLRYRRLIFLASLSVSLSMRMSFVRTGPFTFLVMMRPLSLPSSTRTLTCVIWPVVPVLPIIWMTSAGIRPSASSVIWWGPSFSVLGFCLRFL